MNMLIRKATTEDSKAIATLMLLAMEDIVYRFIGERDKDIATCFLENLIAKEANQYSYENCWVMESEGDLIAVANIYDGAKLYELRSPVIEHLRSEFKRDFNHEDETAAGELYIDCIAVRPDQQGKGIASRLLGFLIQEHSNKTLGLLVDKDNPNAKRLYLKLGFELVDDTTFAGKEMDHLQLKGKK